MFQRFDPKVADFLLHLYFGALRLWSLFILWDYSSAETLVTFI